MSSSSRWFMPLNILTICVIDSALGWLLVKTTRGPQHLKGHIGSCAAGTFLFILQMGTISCIQK